MKQIAFVLIVLISLLAAPRVVSAVGNPPNFPSCSNPTASLKVSYENGQHAIIGETGLRSGKDQVYWVEGSVAIQCFCPENGDGVQTNWWNVPGITQNEIDSYKAQGWYFVPTGASWGLADDPYLAKNVNYSCKGENGGVPSQSSGGVGGGSSVLAATGGNPKYIFAILLGSSLVIGGFMLRKKSDA